MTGREINKLEKRLLQGLDVNVSVLLNVLRSKNTEIAKLKNKLKKIEQVNRDAEYIRLRQTPRPR